MKNIFVFALFFYTCYIQAQPKPFLQRDSNTTPTYYEVIEYWKQLDKQSTLITMKEAGPTDAGLPLHVVYIQQPKLAKNAITIFINNGIHPGEPDGIDASLQIAHHIVNKKITLPNNIRLAIIPVYNVGGCLNRSAYYRVDQNGPDEFGFRGNSQNLDLNRDFIKNDSKEARSFAALFQSLNPQIFIDNHVSNGADYQHTMTLLSTQHNKLGGPMGKFLHDSMEPSIYKLMKTKDWDLVPYVNFFGETPEKGWTEFYDGPRYSSGYSTLWHTFGFVPETHMLKPYPQRVKATFDLMVQFIKYGSEKASTLLQKQKEQYQYYASLQSAPIDWTLDKTKSTSITFNGYESGKKNSLISGQPRLYYDRAKPFTKQVTFNNEYKATIEIAKPKAYIIPQGWWRVIDLLKTNGVEMKAIENDTSFMVESYKIVSYKSGASPYESHHANNSVQVETNIKKVNFRKGDWIISTAQKAGRFLMETLEPQAKDSYFVWNFFDGILGQKEGYSDYMFEETALEILKENPTIKQKLEDKKKADEKFAADGGAQLDFVYKNSKYFETNYMQYPVYRLMK